MDLIVLLRAGALVLAGLAGWTLGRTTPHWAEDRWREDSPHMGMDAYMKTPLDRSGTYGGCFGDLAGIFGRTSTSLCSKMWIPGLLGVLSYVLAIFGWDFDNMVSVFHPGLVYCVIAALAAYIVSRLMDKGPVGPLG